MRTPARRRTDSERSHAASARSQPHTRTLARKSRAYGASAQKCQRRHVSKPKRECSLPDHTTHWNGRVCAHAHTIASSIPIEPTSTRIRCPGLLRGLRSYVWVPTHAGTHTRSACRLTKKLVTEKRPLSHAQAQS
eukprot:6197584-Pleurochrysis_carterae.AAC.1